MKDRQILELSKYRVQQAHETLHEAEILFREGAWRGAVNRSYYAMFYAALALVTVRSYSTSKHAGVIAFFDREFIKTGIFPKELSRNFHLAFDQRQVQDYGEFTVINDTLAQETLANAITFVDAIETYLIGTVFPKFQEAE
ncbi:MAG: HEPN domain-containing protein [Anaerolineales bacterium]|nr:HEPN domain-containing protein [Anaerolineales bacterium]